MKILLTGSTGFFGRIIYKELSTSNIVHTLNRTFGNYIVDLANGKFIIREDYDLVIHAAGLAHVSSKKDSINYDFYKINVTGTENLLQSLKDRKPKYFLFISSVAVYGLQSGINIDEDSPLNATDPYGQSKIFAESIIEQWCNDNQVIFTAYRLPLLFGPEAIGNLKSIIQGIKYGYYFNIKNITVRKSVVLAEDVANLILSSVKIGGIYNLTDGYNPTLEELSESIAKYLGKKRILKLPYALVKILAHIGDCFFGKFPINSVKLIKLSSSLTFSDNKARHALCWRPKVVVENINF